MKKISSLILIIFLSQSVVYSQDILLTIQKANLKLLEHSAIKQTRKKMNLPNFEHLSTFSYFAINFKNKIDNEHCSIAGLLSNMRFCFKDPVSFVFDDSLNVLAEVNKRRVFINFKPEILKEYMYIRYFYNLKPDYIFRIFNTSYRNYLFLCYKNNNIYVVYLSNNDDRIISYALSDFDCRLLYFDDSFQMKVEDLPRLPQE